MLKNNNSLLTYLKVNSSESDELILEVIDPATNSVSEIPSSALSSIKDIQETLDLVKSSLQRDPKGDSNYTFWLNKGWNKSIDYYVSSRAKSFEESGLLTKEVSNPINYTNTSDHRDSSPLFSVPETLLNRRTKRVFNSQKIVGNCEFHMGIKNAVSNIYAFLNGYKIYTIVYNVENIIPGVYLYDFETASLLTISEGTFSEEMSANIQGMGTPRTASFSIILVADFDTLLEKMPYSRGLRDTYIDAGRIAQNLIIAYGQYGIFSLVTPALRDRAVAALLKLQEPDFSPLYSLTFGYPLK